MSITISDAVTIAFGAGVDSTMMDDCLLAAAASSGAPIEKTADRTTAAARTRSRVMTSSLDDA